MFELYNNQGLSVVKEEFVLPCLRCLLFGGFGKRPVFCYCVPPFLVF